MHNDYKEKITDFYQRHKRMPAYSEMMKLFGFKSKNAVYRLVEKMIAAGIVAKDNLGRLIPSAAFDSLPLLGSVKAGFPAEVSEITDSLNIEEYLVSKKASTYILEVDGDSMIDAHIADGDMVIAEKTSNAKVGDIVIAQVDGEFTMKYFRTDAKGPWLEPANKAFKPIRPKHEFAIVAVVRGVIRKY